MPTVNKLYKLWSSGQETKSRDDPFELKVNGEEDFSNVLDNQVKTI